MWNMNDVYVANERYEDIRRAADKHNAVARMTAEGQGSRQPGKQPGEQRTDHQKHKLWERVRRALR